MTTVFLCLLAVGGLFACSDDSHESGWEVDEQDAGSSDARGDAEGEPVDAGDVDVRDGAKDGDDVEEDGGQRVECERPCREIKINETSSRSWETRTRRYFDEDCQWVETEIDRDGDSDIELYLVPHYDEGGELWTKLEYRHASEDGPYHVAYRSYDEQGRISTYRADEGADGEIDVETSYDYHENGEVEERLTWLRDEAYDVRERWTYASSEQIDTYRVEHVASDDGPDFESQLQYREDYTYDDERLARKEIDTNGDGAADRIEDYAYDVQAGGDVVETRIDIFEGERHVERHFERREDDFYEFERYVPEDDRRVDRTRRWFDERDRLERQLEEDFVSDEKTDADFEYECPVASN